MPGGGQPGCTASALCWLFSLTPHSGLGPVQCVSSPVDRKAVSSVRSRATVQGRAGRVTSHSAHSVSQGSGASSSQVSRSCLCVVPGQAAPTPPCLCHQGCPSLRVQDAMPSALPPVSSDLQRVSVTGHVVLPRISSQSVFKLASLVGIAPSTVLPPPSEPTHSPFPRPSQYVSLCQGPVNPKLRLGIPADQGMVAAGEATLGARCSTRPLPGECPVSSSPHPLQKP